MTLLHKESGVKMEVRNSNLHITSHHHVSSLLLTMLHSCGSSRIGYPVTQNHTLTAFLIFSSHFLSLCNKQTTFSFLFCSVLYFSFSYLLIVC